MSNVWSPDWQLPFRLPVVECVRLQKKRIPPCLAPLKLGSFVFFDSLGRDESPLHQDTRTLPSLFTIFLLPRHASIEKLHIYHTAKTVFEETATRWTNPWPTWRNVQAMITTHCKTKMSIFRQFRLKERGYFTKHSWPKNEPFYSSPPPTRLWRNRRL